MLGFVIDDQDALPRAARWRATGSNRTRPLRGRWLSSHASMSRFLNRHWRPTRTAGIFPALISR